MSALKKSWTALLFCGAVVAALSGFCAEQRIAVINMELVFREYYKSRVAEEAIKQQAESYRNYLVRLQEQYNELVKAERTAKSNALNYALSAEQKVAAQQAAEQAEAMVRGKQAEIELYAKERGADMRKLEEAKRNEIVEEIHKEAERRALAEGFSFVVDCSARSSSAQPLFLIWPKENDISQEVIRELNRTRPVENAAPSAVTTPPVPAPQPGGAAGNTAPSALVK